MHALPSLGTPRYDRRRKDVNTLGDSRLRQPRKVQRFPRPSPIRAVDLTSLGDQARIGALWSLREERKARTMGEPVDAYLLYVNQQQVPEVFETLEVAEVSAKPYMQNQATL